MAILLDTSNLAAAFFARAQASGGEVLYVQPRILPEPEATGSRPRMHTTYQTVAERVRKIGAFLTRAGLSPGDRVAIISNTRPEWMETDLGILAAGGVVVSVYPSLTYEEIGYILFDSGARIVFAENKEQVEKLRRLRSEEILMPATEDRPECHQCVVIDSVVVFEEEASGGEVASLSAVLSNTSKEEANGLSAWRSVTPDDMAALVYTSGTTGPPKGVMQTHANHLANIRQAHESGIYRENSTIALFLPLAHSFAKLMGYVGFLTPVKLEFPAIADPTSSKINQQSVIKDLQEGSATVVPVVPRLLEKMQEGVVNRSHGAGPQGALLRFCLWAARERYVTMKRGARSSLLVGVCYTATGFLRAKVKKLLFGRCFAYAVSGGAKLQPAVNEFFDALEIEVLEGYGLTETCVATNVNRSGHKKIGSVGPVLSADVEIKITQEGEICFRGPNVARGYFQRATATSQAWDESGWFHTGDLGRVDAEGFLFIEGRKKELIVTAGGKKVAPEAIENKIKEFPLVSQALLFGDEKPYCVALVSVDHEAVHKWTELGKLPDADSEASADALFTVIWKHVQEINQHLASFESIKRIAIVGEEWTLENGLLTPTMKVKRKEVVKRYREQIEALYQNSGGAENG